MNETIRSFSHGMPVDISSDGTLFRHPERPAPRRDLRAAFRHFRELLKDKEDTSHVFRIFESLPSDDFIPRARAFTLSRQGERIREEEPYLPAILDDHEALRRLPAGSVAHAYCDFMEREGLTAQGLVDEGEKAWPDRPKYGDLVEWYASRRRDTHDLLHVLTGYGRDALGEQCVLAFTYGQNGGFAHLFIAYLGALKVRLDVKSRAPVLRAVRQAQKMGQGAPTLCEMPIRKLLSMPLAEARALMNITEPTLYHHAHAQWRRRGIDPYDLLGQAATA